MPTSFAYPAPFEFDAAPAAADQRRQQQEAPSTPSRRKGQIKTSFNLYGRQSPSTTSAAIEQPSRGSRAPSQRQSRNDAIAASPRREPSRSSLGRRTKSSDEIFCGNVPVRPRSGAGGSAGVVPDSPRRRGSLAGRDPVVVVPESPRRDAATSVPESPRGRRAPPSRLSPRRSKSNDDAFFGALEDAQKESAPKPRPAFPRTKSGRCLPKPVVSRSRTASGGLNKKATTSTTTTTSSSSRRDSKNFDRKAPGKTQSAGNLDSMRQSIAEEDDDDDDETQQPRQKQQQQQQQQVPPPSPRGQKLLSRIMPPPSPSRSSKLSAVPQSPSRRKLWSISPGGTKKEGIHNRSFSKLKGLLASSDHGPSPTTSKSKLKPTAMMNKTIHTDSPSKDRSNNTTGGGGGSDERKKTKTFPQLLAAASSSNKKRNNNNNNSRSKSSTLAENASRERSMSPIRTNDNESRPRSMGALPTISLDDDDDDEDDDISLSPEPSKPASTTGIVAGLWSSFNGSFRRDDDDDDDEQSDEGFGLLVVESPQSQRQRGRTTIDKPIRSPQREASLSPIAVKKPAAGGLITGFIDKMYDSFMNEDDDNGSDDDDFGMLQSSVSRLDIRINQLAGLQ